ncbi:unnamed protein product [Blepharisma stoltei]|uniref:UBC core domain-containing protein n=1 Tax=Blepharisma stoltei TaxID=1481888 RepID=A0AAU9IRA3_9CILI|nr:unnamed protein product [Blepharisma stoltei]
MESGIIQSSLQENLNKSSKNSQAVSDNQESAADSNIFVEKLKLKQCSFIDNLKLASTYLQNVDEAPPRLAERLSKEIKVLSRGLPLDKSCSIFIGIDSNQMRYMSGVIAGSEGTPYAHGLFFFDIFCGPDFPRSPPQVTLKTTGNGEAYFGPNLYSNGYVCLSIINTWSGDESERWNSNKNILQVLLSIQALVMDNNIIQKEPGLYYLDVNCPDSVIFQNAVKYLNIKYAMIKNMRTPPAGFEELVHDYFQLKREFILMEINQWLDKAKNESHHFSQQSIAQSYNPGLCQRMHNEGFFKVLSEIGRELETEFDARYGPCEIKLKLYNRDK